MKLSIKNGWFDNYNRAYIIYTIDNIMEDLGCGKDKEVKVVAELDQKKGIGLIEKVRRGLGKPDLIYVKNFINSKKEALNTDESTEVGKSEFNNTDKQTFESLEKGLQEVGNADSNNLSYNAYILELLNGENTHFEHSCLDKKSATVLKNDFMILVSPIPEKGKIQP